MFPSSGHGLGPGGRRRARLRKRRKKKEERRARSAINVLEAIILSVNPSLSYEQSGTPSARSHNRSNLEFSGTAMSSFIVHHLNDSRSQRILWLLVRLVPVCSPFSLTQLLSRKSSRCPTRSNSTNATQISGRQRNYSTYIRWGKLPSSPMAMLPSQRVVLSFVRTLPLIFGLTDTPTQSILSIGMGMGALLHLRRAN